MIKSDVKKLVADIEKKIEDHVFYQLERHGAVIGLSGGIDSSVTAALCASALGEKNVLGLMMPEADSSKDSLRLGTLLATHLGIASVEENITPVLRAAGCYERRDEAIRTIIPEYTTAHKSKIVSAGILTGEAKGDFRLVVESPEGVQRSVECPPRVLRSIIAATNYKQRVRKLSEYYYADVNHYAVAGTPNRLEYELGFFVKNGDGAADFKPIAHLYKTQVYELARYFNIPREIQDMPPSTDTYSLFQTQEEFYFGLPLAKLDLCLFGKNNNVEVSEVARAVDLTHEQVNRVYDDIETKKKITRYLHIQQLLVEKL
jgi:NAD+ synthase